MNTQPILTTLRPELEDLARAADAAGYESARLGDVDRAAQLYRSAAQLRQEAVTAPSEGTYRFVADRDRHLAIVDAARLDIAAAHEEYVPVIAKIHGGVVATR